MILKFLTRPWTQTVIAIQVMLVIGTIAHYYLG